MSSESDAGSLQSSHADYIAGNLVYTSERWGAQITYTNLQRPDGRDRRPRRSGQNGRARVIGRRPNPAGITLKATTRGKKRGANVRRGTRTRSPTRSRADTHNTTAVTIITSRRRRARPGLIRSAGRRLAAVALAGCCCCYMKDGDRMSISCVHALLSCAWTCQ
jgi:hypothetical protein